jgi:protein involved in polysaccharide export with SLBB domain
MTRLSAGPGKAAPQPKDRTTADKTGAVPSAKEERSEFEKFISGNVSAPASLDIRQFGYDLFDKPPSSFAPVQNVPVGPDYVVGPGDGMKVDVWGKIEGSWSVIVDNDGNIVLPKVGVIGVTGLTFKELKEVLQNVLPPSSPRCSRAGARQRPGPCGISRSRGTARPRSPSISTIFS